MTAANITSGFEMTGVYLLNQEALTVPTSFEYQNLTEKNWPSVHTIV